MLRVQTLSRRSAFTVSALLASLGAATSACAVPVFWANPNSAFFDVGAAWVGGSPPGASDEAWFNNNGTFAVQWDEVTGDRTNEGLRVQGPADVQIRSDSDPDTFEYSLNGAAGTAGQVIIESGGRLTIGSTTSANQGMVVNAQRTVEVSDGSSLTIANGGVLNETGGIFSPPDGTFIGAGSGGSLRIEQGGVFNSSTAAIGTLIGFPATDATVTGTGSVWSISNQLRVASGVNSAATVDVLDGGQVISDGSFWGSGANSDATLRIDGPNSELQSNNSTQIGGDGRATVDVTNQGSLRTAFAATIGVQAGSFGTVTLDGLGSDWTATGTLSVGFRGEGTLNIRNGAKMSSTFLVTTATARIGADPTGVGRVAVEGQGSLFSMEESIRVGIEGQGSLSVITGGSVSTATSMIGELAGGTGIATVDGPGSQWVTTGSMGVGGSPSSAGGSGELTASDSGLVQVNGTLKLWSQGELNIYGGFVNVTALEVEPGAAIDFRHGTLGFASGLTVQPGDALEVALGRTRNVRFGQLVQVAGLTVLNDVLTLDGGSFTTQGILNVQLLDFQNGDLFITDAAGVTVGAAGQFGQSLTAGAGQAYQAFSLTVDPGALVTLEPGGVVEVLGTIDNGGRILGSGRMNGIFNNLSGGEVIANQGDFLLIGGAGTNNGQITLNGGQIVLTQGLTNSATGLVLGNGTLRADGGIANDGDMAFTATANVVGDLTNNATGEITSSGGTLTFFDDVVNNGTIRTNANSFTVYFGSYSGAGDAGTGTVIMEGDLKPGSSPGIMSFGGDLSFGSGATLEIELAGTAAGTDYDVIDVTDALVLDGTLDVLLINGFSPSAGDSFDILDFASLSGTFNAVNLPALTGNLQWDATELYVDGTLSVFASIPADLDGDGDVDGVDLSIFFSNFTGPGGGPPSNPAADLDGDGDVDGVDLSQAFSAFTGPLSPVVVPEPAAVSWLALAGLALVRRRRRAMIGANT